MKKRSFLLFAGAVVLCIAGGLLYAKSYYETKIRDGIENFFTTLPASVAATHGTIDISLLDRAVTIHDIKGSYSMDALNEKATFALESLTAKGVNFFAFDANAGTTALAGDILVSNFTTSSSLFSQKIALYHLEDIKGNFHLLREQFIAAAHLMADLSASADPNTEKKQKESAVQEHMASLVALIKSYETVTIKKVVLKGYEYTLTITEPPFSAWIGEIEAQNNSLREVGPMKFVDMRGSRAGTPLFSWEEVSIEHITLPDFVPLIQAVMPSPEAHPLGIIAALKGQPFAVHNMRSKNYRAQSPDKGGKIFSLADFMFSYDNAQGHVTNIAFSGLDIEKNFLKKEAVFSPNALALLPEVISIKGALDLTVTLDETGQTSLDCKTLRISAANLGGISLGMSIAGLNPMLLAMGSPDRSVLNKFTSVTTDEGISEVFYTQEGEQQGKSAAQMRAESIADIESTRATLSETLQELLNAVVQFMEKPGQTFSFSLSPQQPIPLPLLQQKFLQEPESLGISFSLTPQ